MFMQNLLVYDQLRILNALYQTYVIVSLKGFEQTINFQVFVKYFIAITVKYFAVKFFADELYEIYNNDAND